MDEFHVLVSGQLGCAICRVAGHGHPRKARVDVDHGPGRVLGVGLAVDVAPHGVVQAENVDLLMMGRDNGVSTYKGGTFFEDGKNGIGRKEKRRTQKGRQVKGRERERSYIDTPPCRNFFFAGRYRRRHPSCVGEHDIWQATETVDGLFVHLVRVFVTGNVGGDGEDFGFRCGRDLPTKGVCGLVEDVLSASDDDHALGSCLEPDFGRCL